MDYLFNAKLKVRNKIWCIPAELIIETGDEVYMERLRTIKDTKKMMTYMGRKTRQNGGEMYMGIE